MKIAFTLQFISCQMSSTIITRREVIRNIFRIKFHDSYFLCFNIFLHISNWLFGNETIGELKYFMSFKTYFLVPT